MVERSPCHILVSLAALGHQVEDVSFFGMAMVLVLVLQPWVTKCRLSFRAIVVEAQNTG